MLVQGPCGPPGWSFLLFLTPNSDSPARKTYYKFLVTHNSEGNLKKTEESRSRWYCWQLIGCLPTFLSISQGRLINIPTCGIFGNIPNFSPNLDISRACLINFPSTGKFGNMPNIPSPGRAIGARHAPGQYAPLINPSGGRGALENLGISCIFAAPTMGLLWGLISGR